MVVGIEIDRGLVVGHCLAAGYEVYAINPMASARYRDRHATSRAKSDPGDAKVLADLVRTDRHNHRPIAGDSDLAEGVKLSPGPTRARSGVANANSMRCVVVARVLPRRPRGLRHRSGQHRCARRLAIAPTPELGRGLSRSKVASALRKRWPPAQRRAPRRRDPRGAARRAPRGPIVVANAHGARHPSAVALITTFNAQIAELEAALSEHFEQHPDAKVVLSLPGLGTVLGARVLGEFGDDRTRFSGPKSRKNYAGTSPVTKASGRSRVVLARYALNRHLGDACDQWAFCAITKSAGARDYYDQLRARGKTHRQALRQLANRLVGNPPRVLGADVLYDE